MHLLLRLGIAAFIVCMFFIANHLDTGNISLVFRIFGTIGLFQIIVSYYLTKQDNTRMQNMLENGKVTEEYETKPYLYAAVKGSCIAFVFLIVLYLPFYIALGWVWILSYLVALWAIPRYLQKYAQERSARIQLRSELQLLTMKTHKQPTKQRSKARGNHASKG